MSRRRAAWAATSSWPSIERRAHRAYTAWVQFENATVTMRWRRFPEAALDLAAWLPSVAFIVALIARAASQEPRPSTLPITVLFWTGTLLLGALAFRLPERLESRDTATVEVTDGELRLGRRRIPRSDLASGYTADARVEIVLASGEAMAVELASAADATRVVDALGLGPMHRPALF